MTVVPRFPAGLARAEAVDAQVLLPGGGGWLEVLTGERIETDAVLPLSRMPLPWAVLDQG